MTSSLERGPPGPSPAAPGSQPMRRSLGPRAPTRSGALRTWTKQKTGPAGSEQSLPQARRVKTEGPWRINHPGPAGASELSELTPWSLRGSMWQMLCDAGSRLTSLSLLPGLDAGI